MYKSDGRFKLLELLFFIAAPFPSELPNGDLASRNGTVLLSLPMYKNFPQQRLVYPESLDQNAKNLIRLLYWFSN